MTAERNYRIVDLSPTGTVIVEVEGERRDTGERPVQWGLFGLTPAEQRILRKGMTRRERKEVE